MVGGRDGKGAMARQTTVKTFPRTVSVAEGDETKKSELKDNTGAKTRETKVKPLPNITIVAGGARKGENLHEMERWHNPQSRERVKCLAENAYQRENKITCITKKKRQTIQSCATV